MIHIEKLVQMKTKILFLILAMVGLQVLPQEKTSESGIVYTLVEAGEESIPASHRILLRFTYRDAKDSLYWGNVSRKNPSFTPKSAFADKIGMVDELSYNANEGDSIEVRLPVKQIFDNVPEGVNPDEIWTANFRIEGSMSRDEYLAFREEQLRELRPDDDKDGMKQLAVDVDLINQYLKNRNQEAQKTASGLHYRITKKGEGEPVRAGDTIRANYTGYLLSTGFHFDTSVEEVAREHNLYDPSREYEPYKTVIGERMVIRGWDEGFQLLREGEKATFYIPSLLAYGPRVLSRNIPANSVMIFEVELVEIIRAAQDD